MLEQVEHDAVTSIAPAGHFRGINRPALSSADNSLGQAYQEVVPATSPPSVPELGEGTRLGERYEIVRKLGQGGMGVVYEARNTNVEHIRYAIKTLLPGKSHADSTHFLQEAKRASRVRSPHIVQIFDFGTDSSSGLTYMVMDYIGEDLETYIRRHGGTLPPPLAVELCVQVCEALIAAHSQKLVHRDIKPLNCLLRVEGDRETIVVTDFGIARDILGTLQRNEAGLVEAQAWTAVGTPGYIAPEIWLREPGADHRVDIYSVGAMLFRMLVGQLPPLAPTDEELKSAGLPPELLPILARAMARSPRDRQASARALQDELRAVAPRLAAGGAPVASQRGASWMAWTAVMLASVAVGLYALLYTQSGEAESSGPPAPATSASEIQPPAEPSPPAKTPTEQSPAEQPLPVKTPPIKPPDPREDNKSTTAEPIKQRPLPTFAERRMEFDTALQASCKQLAPCTKLLKLKQSGPFEKDTLEVMLYFRFSPRKAYPTLESRDPRLDLRAESNYRACVEKRMRSVKEFTPTRDGDVLTCPTAL